MNPRTRSALRLGTLLLAVASLTGCGQPVREDRTVSWSAGGKEVGFQHGPEGVFVADPDGGGLIKVFQPGPDVVAVSTPLWSPAGKRVIFATARPATQAQPTPARQSPHDPDPAGNVHFQQSVIYTCYLVEDVQAPQPVPIFDAGCDHVGYVAANLAVRWHPHGRKIFYINETNNRQHTIYEFDLESWSHHPAVPFESEAIVFDWSPDGSSFVCVRGTTGQAAKDDGIWVSTLGKNDWWHVPGSENLAAGELPSTLEKLRATQPVWSPDSSQFVFASATAASPPPAGQKPQPDRHFLKLGSRATGGVKTLATGDAPYRQMRWTPDGKRIGVLRGQDAATLLLVEPDGRVTGPINRFPVSSFAGWNRSGSQLAYVGRSPQPVYPGEKNLALFRRNPEARETIILAGGPGQQPDREVFAGMRVTFPHWSPQEGRLSFWATFTPNFEPILLGSPTSEIGSWGLRRGDPAAILDADTGKLQWKPVNAFEKAQVGHYYLLKKDYAEAWKWYEAADQEAAGVGQKDADPLSVVLGLARDHSLFEYVCLKKLGRLEEAGRRLNRFRGQVTSTVKRDPVNQEPVAPNRIGDIHESQLAFALQVLQTMDQDGHLLLLVRDQYIGQVFLSVDAVDDGENYFLTALAEADTDPAKLSSGLLLSQFLLLQGKTEESLALAKTTLLPILEKLPAPARPIPPNQAAPPSWLLLAGWQCLEPLLYEHLLPRLPKEKVRFLADRWQDLRPQAVNAHVQLTFDRLLAAAYRGLGDRVQLEKAAERIKNNPLSAAAPAN